MKFVLVIDVADDVAEAYDGFTVDYDLRGTPKEDQKVNESIKYVEDARLRPLPKRIPPNEYGNITPYGSIWNACLDAIVGETE